MSHNISEWELTCLEARRAVQTTGLSTLYGFQVLLGAVAAVTNGLLTAATWHSTVFGSDLRLLLVHFSGCLILFSVTRLTKSTVLLISYYDNPCQYITTSRQCRLAEIPIVFCNHAIIWSFLMICIERLWASCNLRKVETTRRPGVAMTLIGVWACASALTTGLNFSVEPRGDGLVPACDSILALDEANLAPTTGSFCVLLVSMVCATVSHFWNQRQLRLSTAHRAHHTLSTRFVIKQNVQVNRMLMPDVLVMFICYTPLYVMLLLVFNEFRLSMESKAIWVHISYCWRVGFALVHPLLSFKLIRQLAHRLKAIMPKFVKDCFCSKVQSAQPKAYPRASGHDHFRILDNIWSTRIVTSNRLTKPVVP